MNYTFERDVESGIILVTVLIDGKHSFKMVLDTGASRTTIDTTALYLAGYELNKEKEKCEIETANGIVEVEVFEIGSIAAFSHIKQNIPIQAYDFLAHGILSDYDGLLGLDFFENTCFSINLKENSIKIM